MKRALSGDIYIQTKAAKLRLTERWVGPGTSARLEARPVGLAEHLFVPRGTAKRRAGSYANHTSSSPTQSPGLARVRVDNTRLDLLAQIIGVLDFSAVCSFIN